MKLLIALVAAAALAGCGATIQTSNERQVVVHAVGSKQAQPLADQECAKHKRFARLVGGQDFNYLFYCVE